MDNKLAVRNEMNIMDIAGAFVKSGYFQDSRDVNQAIVKILAGHEFGYGPFASMTGIYIIQGRPSMSANLMASAVKQSGRYDYRVRKMDDKECSIEFLQRTGDKWESIGVSTFNIEDAKKAGTKNLDKFPRNMLFARAMSNGVRWFCPDTFSTSVYTPEELGADVNEEGHVIESSFTNSPQEQIVDSIPVEPEPEPQPMTLEDAMNMRTSKGTQFGELSDEQLQFVIDKTGDPLKKQAAQMILAHFGPDAQPQEAQA